MIKDAPDWSLQYGSLDFNLLENDPQSYKAAWLNHLRRLEVELIDQTF